MDIQKKNIFDYCNDEKLRKSIIGDYTKEYYDTLPPVVKLTHLRSFAAMTGNKTLFREVSAALSKENDTLEKVQDEEQQKGRIVDY